MASSRGGLPAAREDRATIVERLRDVELAGLGAEVREALGHEHHPGTSARCFADEPVYRAHVGIHVTGRSHLDDRDRHPTRLAQCENLRIETFMSKPRPSIVESKLEPP